MAKNCMEITKSTLLGQNSEYPCRGQANFFGQSGGLPQSLEETLVPSFSLSDNLVFWTKVAQKKAFPVENWKKGTSAFYSAYQISLQISLSTKFLPKWTILTFLTKFSQKSYVQSKRKKVNSKNELFIFCIQVISE